jgi:multiple sugar transport system permease protein
MRRTKKSPHLIIVFVALLASLVILFPFVLMLITSLKTLKEIQSPAFTFVPAKLMISNYVDAMRTGNWARYFFNSVYVTLMTLLFGLVINSLAGYSFARLEFKGKNLIFLISLIGLMIPIQVRMVPIFLVLKNFPLAGGNNILGRGGRGFINSYAGLILPFICGSYGVFLFRQFFLNFPLTLDDAARIDGLNTLQRFYYIYVPLSKPVFATLVALKSTDTWNQYTWPLIITTTDKMKTVQLALTLFHEEFLVQWHLLMAATTLVTLPLVVLFLSLQKFFVQGIVTTGMKG